MLINFFKCFAFSTTHFGKEKGRRRNKRKTEIGFHDRKRRGFIPMFNRPLRLPRKFPQSISSDRSRRHYKKPTAERKCQGKHHRL